MPGGTRNLEVSEMIWPRAWPRNKAISIITTADTPSSGAGKRRAGHTLSGTWSLSRPTDVAWIDRTDLSAGHQ